MWKNTCSAEKLALQLNVKPTLKVTRIRRKKKQYDYESTDKVSDTESPESYLKNHVFNNILDQAITSIYERFKKTSEFNDTWRFWFNYKDSESHEDLLKSCQDLHLKLSDQNGGKTDGIDLCNEIKIEIIITDYSSVYILSFINNNKLQEILLNLMGLFKNFNNNSSNNCKLWIKF